MNSPEVSKALHKVSAQSYDHYEVYKQHLQGRPRCATCWTSSVPIPIEEVEPVTEIVKRFCTGGMSLGTVGKPMRFSDRHEPDYGKSTGEGGEDPIRYKVLDDVGTDGTSATTTPKGLANGIPLPRRLSRWRCRFGVTPEYLMNAKQLEIKIAQVPNPEKAVKRLVRRSAPTSPCCADKTGSDTDCRLTTISIR